MASQDDDDDRNDGGDRDDDDDRAAILGRRALLATTALAGLSAAGLGAPTDARAQGRRTPRVLPPPHPVAPPHAPCLQPMQLPPRALFVRSGRIAVAAAAVPAEIRQFFHSPMIYAGGSGALGRPWRVQVNHHGAGYAAEGMDRGAPFAEHLSPRTRAWDFDVQHDEELHELFALADECWRTPLPPQPPAEPAWVYGEVLVLFDGADAFIARGVGPSLGAPAEHLMQRMRALFERSVTRR